MNQRERRAEEPATIDTQLLLAISGQRDRAAFVRLWGLYAPRLKAWFRRAGCSVEQADDIVQETMLSVWRKADRFDPDRAGASTWIFTIARDQRVDAPRRSRRPDLNIDDPSILPIESVSPDVAYDARERERHVREALRTLPADQAEVIRFSFFDHHPHAEIDRSLGIPLGTVKSRLRRAMIRLRIHLKDIPAGSAQCRSGEQP